MNAHSNSHDPHRWFSWRIVLALALVLAALAYVLPLAASRLIGQDVLRADAQAALASALDHPVDIQGDVGLTLVPWFGLRTGPVTVANDPEFGPAPLLHADSVTIGLNLRALFRKRVVVDSIALTAASLNLGRDEAGRENWRPVVQGEQPPPPLLRGWKVESLPTGLRLWNARLTYTDRQTGVSLDVRRLTLDSSQSRPFDFSISCQMTAAPWGVSGELAAKGTGSYGGEGGGHVFVHTSQVTGWMQLPASAGLPGGRVGLSGQVKVHGESGAFEVADMVLEGLGARITGQVNAAGLYEEHPYLYLKLAAEGDRNGAWTELLGLDHSTPPVFSAPARKSRNGREEEESAIKRPPPTQDIEAELEVAATPLGWLTKHAVLRDGPGRLEGSASDIGGDVSFDVQADNLDLTPWLKVKTPPIARSGPGPRSVKGRFSGKDLRLGPFDFLDVELAALGQQGALRLYPFTARTDLALFTSDFRLKPGEGTYDFSGNTRIQALSVESAVDGPPVDMAEANLDGAIGPENITGSLRLGVAEFSSTWKPTWLSENFQRAWSILGGGSAQASFSLPRGPSQAWNVPDFTLKTGYSQVTGKASGDAGRTSLDVQADRLDLDRLRQLAGLLATSDGYIPWPVEARIAVKRFSTPGAEVDDLLVAGQASPDSLKLSTLSGVALGGRFTGALELEDRPDHHTLAGSLAVAGVQGAQLRTLLPDAPRLLGPLECHLSLDGSTPESIPVWQGLRGQADLQLGPGAVTFSPGEEGSQPWPLSRASASLKFTTKPVQAQAGEHHREAATADVTGMVRVDSPGMVRSSQVELKGQAGLDSSGKPLWYRQPVASGAHVLNPLFAPPGKTVRATWSGKFEADLERGGFSFSGIDLNVAGVPGRASLGAQPAQGAQGAQGGLVLAGNVDIPEFNPREAALRLGYALPVGAAPDHWRRARFSAQFGGNLKEIRLTDIQAGLDDSTVTGQAGFSGLRTRLDLSVDTLDLDSLAPSPTYPNPAKRPEEPLPLAELRALSLEAKLRFGRLVKGHLVWENALTEFTAQGGRIQIRQSAPSFYGGPYQVDITGDARGSDLKARMNLALTGFSAAALLKDLAEAGSLSKGTADFQVDVETHGATDRALKRNASGTSHFEVRGGRLAIGETTGRPRQPAQPAGRTPDRDASPPQAAPSSDGVDFSRLAANFSVRDGLAITRDLVLSGPSLSAKGDGWVNLDDERIDLSLTANIPDVGELPVRISGPLYDPKLDIDKSRIIGDTILKVFKGVVNLPGNVINQFRRLF
jgi:hypothetical protein